MLESYIQALMGQELEVGGQINLAVEYYCRFILELSLLNFRLQRFRPSILALSAMLVCHDKMNRYEPYREMKWGPRFEMLQGLVVQENQSIQEVSQC